MGDIMKERFMGICLYSSARDVTKLITVIKNTLGENCFHVVEENEQVSYTLFDYTKYNLTISSDSMRKEFFEEQKTGAMGYYLDLECDNTEVKDGLVKQLSLTNSIYYITFPITEDESRTQYLYTATLKIAESINALLVVGNKDVINFKGELVMSHKGESKVIAHEVKVDTESLYVKGELTDYDKEVYNASKNRLKQENLLHLEEMRLALRNSEIKLKSVEEICRRAVSLFAVARFSEALLSHAGYTEALNRVESLSKFDVNNSFSDFEARYIKLTTIPNELRMKFVWCYESCSQLLHSLGLLKELNPYNEISNVEELINVFNSFDNLEDMINKSKLKTSDELFRLQDITMRYHWLCVELRLQKIKLETFNEGVLTERHKALNWMLSDIFGESWDKVETPS